MSTRGELARQIGMHLALRLRKLLGHDCVDPELECFIYHEAIAAFERATFAAWKHGLIVGLAGRTLGAERVTYSQVAEEVRSTIDCCYFAAPPISVLKSANTTKDIGDTGIEELLSGYVALADLGPDNDWRLPTGRSQRFKAPHDDVSALVEVLCQHDYLSRAGDWFEWTDRPACIMIENFRWDESDIDLKRVDQEFADAQVLKILDETDGKQWERHLNFSPAWIAFHIMKYWTGSAWVKEPIAQTRVTFDNALQIGKTIKTMAGPTENG